jgi:hypothetical protein
MNLKYFWKLKKLSNLDSFFVGIRFWFKVWLLR